MLSSSLLRSAKDIAQDQRVKVRLGVAEFAIYIPDTVNIIFMKLLVNHFDGLGGCYNYRDQKSISSTFFGKDMIMLTFVNDSYES